MLIANNSTDKMKMYGDKGHLYPTPFLLSHRLAAYNSLKNYLDAEGGIAVSDADTSFVL